jgi:lipoprotein NlpD
MHTKFLESLVLRKIRILMDLKKIIAFIYLCIFLLSCSSTQLEEVSEKRHFVRSGETLYVIAWRYGLNYQNLISWNKISSDGLIYPGQILKLSAPTGYVKIKNAPVKSTKQKIARLNKQASIIEDNRNLKWTSPTRGKVIRKFSKSSKLFGGILLGGKLGQSVNAASDGRVVYAGNGLVGYGQLIIIEHNNTYLSAYGYNEGLIVKEGDWITKGQKIATMGIGPEQLPRLYFEIRRNSNPVDPLNFIGNS